VEFLSHTGHYCFHLPHKHLSVCDDGIVRPEYLYLECSNSLTEESVSEHRAAH